MMRDWINDFRKTIDISAERLRNISDAESSRSVGDDAWCAKEILGHLIDSATNNHARFVLAQTKDDLNFPGYDQDRWVQVQRYRNASWQELVDLWRAYNLHLAHIMSCASAEALSRSRTQHTLQTIAFKTVAETEPATLEYLMKDYIEHLKHHLNQILEKQ